MVAAVLAVRFALGCDHSGRQGGLGWRFPAFSAIHDAELGLEADDLL